MTFTRFEEKALLRLGAALSEQQKRNYDYNQGAIDAILALLSSTKARVFGLEGRLQTSKICEAFFFWTLETDEDGEPLINRYSVEGMPGHWLEGAHIYSYVGEFIKEIEGIDV